MTDELTGGLSQVLSGDAWSGAQYLPGPAVAALGEDDDPKKKPATTIPATDRLLTGDEWAAAQRKSGPEVRRWQIPRIPAAPRDVTRTPNDPTVKGYKVGEGDPGLHGILTRQLVAPALENPFTTAATLAAVPAAAAASPLAGAAVGAAMAGSMVYHIAQYGWQKLAEATLSPEDRARAEADPERISGESAAVQAAMLGLAPLIHVGVKGAGRIRSSLDYGAGVTEAGARGVGELDLGPQFSGGFADRVANERFARGLEEGSALRFPNDGPRTAGLVPSREVQAPARQPRPIPGLEVPEAVKAGKVTPVETTDAAAPLDERAAIDQSVRDYQRTRAAQDAQDLADARRAEAERVAQIAGGIRRRPGGAKLDEPKPFFESEHGAETLGVAAARHGLPNDASPYPPETPNDVAWKSGHAAATESFPEGFSMGGALTDNRIPGASEVPKSARGSDAPAGFQPTELPEGATPETAALAAALKPSRYRAHTVDQLVESVIDARERLDAAQRDELHYSEGQLADYQAKIENNQEAEFFYAKTREKETARAKSALAQIERELVLRGVNGDHLAEKIQEAQDARAERKAMQEESSLALLMGEDDPFAESTAPAPASDPVAAGSTPAQAGGSSPVVGTGETRTRGLASAIERKAIANKLATTLGPLPEYQRVSMAEQADQAAALLARDPALARRVALGQAPAPEGLLPESVLVAVENRATAEGDVATLRELATGQLGEQITHMGQRIRALAERDPDSPVGAIQKVVDARAAAVKNVPRATEDVVAAIRAKLSESSVSAEKLAEFLKSLEC